MDSTTPRFESPAELTAILVAAHKVGDRELERAARRELEERYGIQISFARGRTREVVSCTR